jgi:hypothetical protein
LAWQHLPAFMLLAQDIRLTGFALRVQRVEGLIETFFRRLPRIDGAANAGWRGHLLLPLGLVPKKAGPDQRVPVIRFAMADKPL